MLAACLALSGARALAHPLHSGYAEADYRPATHKLEIAIRLFTDDTEVALSQRAGKKISVDTTPRKELDALVLAYVRANFAVKAKDGAAAPLEWIGRELKDSEQHLWIYVQCALPGGVAGARFRNGLLRDAFSDQINSVRVRDHERSPPAQVTLLFIKDGEQTVAFGK